MNDLKENNKINEKKVNKLKYFKKVQKIENNYIEKK